MSEARRPCPSKRTDAKWTVLEPLLPPPAGRSRPPKRRRRATADAIFHLVQSGCAWRMLPQEFPPSGKARSHGVMSAQLTGPTIYWWFRRFVRLLLFRTIHDLALMLDRERAGREASPSGGILDSQSVTAPQSHAEPTIVADGALVIVVSAEIEAPGHTPRS